MLVKRKSNWYNIGVNMVENKKQEKKFNLKNDIIFKTFFSRKGNEEFLIDFLSALLKIEITNIKIDQEVNLESLAQDEKVEE